MNVKDYFNFIDFSPLFEEIKKRGIKMKFLAEKIGVSSTTFSELKSKKALPSTEFISLLAAFFNVPVSALVKLTGFEVREPFINKEFTPIYNPEYKLTYQSLRDLVEKYKKNGETIQDVFDRVPKLDINNNAKERYEYMMLEHRGVIVDGNAEVKAGRKIDKTGRMRHTGGLSSTNRAKINRDESVSFRIVYDICKILRCNVDFVLGWK